MANLATAGHPLKHPGLPLAPLWPGNFDLLPCLLTPLGCLLAHFGLNLAFLNVNFALHEPCLHPSSLEMALEACRGPLRTLIFLQEKWFSLRKR